MTDKLREFYTDKAMMDAVAIFFKDVLQDMAIKRVFKKQDTSGLVDTKEVLEKAFVLLKDKYEPPKARKVGVNNI